MLLAAAQNSLLEIRPPAVAARVFCAPPAQAELGLAASGEAPLRCERGDWMAQRRRGRKTKPGSRQPNGQLRRPADDPELSGVAHRRIAALELSGAERDQRAEYPLGVIRARGLIREVEHNAGLEYERLHRRVEQPRTPPSCLGAMVPSGAGTISIAAPPSPQTQALYLRIREALKGAGTRTWSQTRDVVIYHHWPRFLDTARRRPPAAWKADERDLNALINGLDVIARVLDLRAGKTDRSNELKDSAASFVARHQARVAAE